MCTGADGTGGGERDVVIAGGELEIWVAAGASLKDRRRVVRSLVDRLRARLNVSVVELEQPAGWQRARLAVACASATETHARELMAQVRRMVEESSQAQLTHFDIGFYR